MGTVNLPRVELAHLPTPFERLGRLSAHLGGPNIYVKRDDCTGLAGGGNKTRKLEFLMADALAHGADTIVTVGATQSNHVRQTIAACAKLGLNVEVLLEKAVVRDDDYARNGNFMLDGLMGATIHECESGEDMDIKGQAYADTLCAQGHKTYFIPTGGSSPIGVIGYMDCITEILSQSQKLGINIDAIIAASGSQGTQAGLVLGLAQAKSNIPIYGISVARERQDLEERVFALAKRAAKLAKLDVPIERKNVMCDDNYLAPGYGLPNAGMVEAVKLCARLEALLIDPVYSGKAMAGLIDKIRKGEFTKGQNIVFIHTGGQIALHAYRSEFEA
ncbi:MAG: D-cysteine desulfhydrase [Robiginitomaculum sp.]|nr:D-cysteine desulfhydrase [Robiginitomaculum sp.]